MIRQPRIVQRIWIASILTAAALAQACTLRAGAATKNLRKPAMTSASIAPNPSSTRRFEVSYNVELPAIKRSEGAIDLFIPLAVTDHHQHITRRRITTTMPGVECVDGTYGNRFWHGHLDHGSDAAINVTITYALTRTAFSRDLPANNASRALTAAEQRTFTLFLQPNQRVPIAGALIRRLQHDLPANDGTPLGRARAIYAYVLANMTYKKVGSGWGNGDTYWACSEKYGNCTDFHALFISLARAEGIPARFEMGVPLPKDRISGQIAGYHCWVEFYIGGVGWVPVDVSEAAKHPEKRAFFFGHHPADRMQLSVGRDLELGAGHVTGPLNYFVFPHLEVGGKRRSLATRRLSFRVL